MRRIEFLAPVEAMRGNLSGKQSLLYPSHDNAAFDAPEGRQYARNYNTRYIGAKRSSDNFKFFSVKTKAAVKVTAASKLNMALLGVSSVIANLIKRDMSTLGTLEGLYINSGDAAGISFKGWLMRFIRDGLQAKRNFVFSVYDQAASVVYLNPYVNSPFPEAHAVQNFPDDMLVKFWLQLADNPSTFTIQGINAIGLAHNGDRTAAQDRFTDIIGSSFNVLGLHTDNEGHILTASDGIITTVAGSLSDSVEGGDYPYAGDVYYLV